ncbi:MAG: TIGR04255 family protein [Clostridia bacterium]|nr:TIGR04255 family protein [Clostridia bacterium]
MVDKEQFKRKDLKSNFLKQMIIRIDYDYLFEKDMENIVQNSYSYLIDNDYKMKSSTLAEFKVDLNTINKTSDNNNVVRVDNSDKEEFFSFVKDENNIVIDITRNFATMTVNYEKFIYFNNLIEEFSKVVEKIKNIRKGLEIKRIGIRKINMYILKDINKINEYFETNLFSLHALLEDKESLLAKQTLERFMMGEYKVNELCNISQGILADENGKQQTAYQVIVDIDVYDDIVKNNEICLEKINEEVFKVYKSALKIEFLEKLKKENYQDEVLIKYE